MSISQHFFLLVFLITVVPSNAAEINIAKNGIGNSQLGSIISVEGQIEIGDSLKFQNIAKDAGQSATVVLNSDGGSLIAGIEIGREIKRLGYQTAVVNTCASACALAWLAGKNKFSSDKAKIGFHVAYIDGVQKQESGMGNAIVGLYVGELGYGQNVVEYVTSAAPDDIRFLSIHDAELLGIKVETFQSKTTETVSSAPTTDYSELKLKAVSFVYDNIAAHSNNNQDALISILKDYAPKVLYYGKELEITQIYLDKQSYFTRWPIRSSTIRDDSVTVECQGAICIVSGIYQWQVSSLARGKSASGLASFSYGLQVIPAIQVLSESGKVLAK